MFNKFDLIWFDTCTVIRFIHETECLRIARMSTKAHDSSWVKPSPRNSNMISIRLLSLRWTNAACLLNLFQSCPSVHCWAGGPLVMPLADEKSRQRKIVGQPLPIQKTARLLLSDKIHAHTGHKRPVYTPRDVLVPREVGARLLLLSVPEWLHSAAYSPTAVPMSQLFDKGHRHFSLSWCNY